MSGAALKGGLARGLSMGLLKRVPRRRLPVAACNRRRAGVDTVAGGLSGRGLVQLRRSSGGRIGLPRALPGRVFTRDHLPNGRVDRHEARPTAASAPSAGPAAGRLLGQFSVTHPRVRLASVGMTDGQADTRPGRPRVPPVRSWRCGGVCPPLGLSVCVGAAACAADARPGRHWVALAPPRSVALFVGAPRGVRLSNGVREIAGEF